MLLLVLTRYTFKHQLYTGEHMNPLSGDTAVARIESIVLNAGVEPKHVKSTIAGICGITAQSVHGWFTGSTKNPSSENSVAIALHYGVDVIWIIMGSSKELITCLDGGPEVHVIYYMSRGGYPWIKHVYIAGEPDKKLLPSLSPVAIQLLKEECLSPPLAIVCSN